MKIELAIVTQEGFLKAIGWKIDGEIFITTNLLWVSKNKMEKTIKKVREIAQQFHQAGMDIDLEEVERKLSKHAWYRNDSWYT